MAERKAKVSEEKSAAVVDKVVADMTLEERLERCRMFALSLRKAMQNEHDATKDVTVRRVLQRLLAIKP